MNASIGKPFERLGGALVDPDMVLPAALPLDLCGESVRARLCVFADHQNQDLALRPDLTLPVALEEIKLRESGSVKGEHVQRYHARAFRQAVADEPMEFIQTGFERFGAPTRPEIDAEVFGLVSDAAIGAGVHIGVARFGDLGILPGIIELLDLSDATKAGLRRAFREEGGVRAFLDRSDRASNLFVYELQSLDRGAVEAKIAEKFKAESITHFSDRTTAEIVTRLMEQAEEIESGNVSDLASETLEAVLELQCKPSDAANRLRTIAQRADIETGLSPLLDGLEERHALISQQAPEFLEGAMFSPAFGRRFTYYDGFVFEIGELGERRSSPFGAGGRYDALLTDLSHGSVSATAIGGVVRPDRLALARANGATT
jgi:ATP phosphoribosyltransferase regulatory subunit